MLLVPDSTSQERQRGPPRVLIYYTSNFANWALGHVTKQRRMEGLSVPKDILTASTIYRPLTSDGRTWSQAHIKKSSPSQSKAK